MRDLNLGKIFPFLLGSALSVVAMADNEDMKNTRDGVKAAFPTYVSSTFESYVSQYFAIRQFDYFSYTNFLINSEQKQLEIISNTEIEMQQLRGKSIEEQGPRYEWLILRLRSAESELERLQQLQVDIKDSWAKTCSDSGMSFAKSFYVPELLFPIDSLHLSNKGSGYTFTVNYQFGSTTRPDGTVQGGGLSSPVGGTTDERDAFIEGGCIAAGTIVGTILPGIGNVVGAGVGALVGTLSVFLLHGFLDASSQNERWDLLAEIRSFMSDTVHHESAISANYLKNYCANSLQTGDVAKVLTQQIASGADNLQPRLDEARSILATEQAYLDGLTTQAKQRLALLKDAYFSNLTRNYMESADTYLKDTVKYDRDAMSFATANIYPLLKQIQPGMAPTSRVAAQDLVWSQLIEGDGSLGAGATTANQIRSFSFGLGATPETGSFWSNLVKVTLQKGFSQ